MENYTELVAFVGLLNALLRASGASLPGQGRPYAHFTNFVRVEVLGQLHQRAYRQGFFSLLKPTVSSCEQVAYCNKSAMQEVACFPVD